MIERIHDLAQPSVGSILLLDKGALMKRYTKAGETPAKKLIVPKLKSKPKPKTPISFKSAEWYASAARSFGLSAGSGSDF
jgi:hypothetical protein